ncbi:hypothetical protein BGX27_002235, partial [Mortierella sp. AM989]
PYQELQDAANRLTAEWTSKKASRDTFWEELAIAEELEKEKQRKIRRLKQAGERRLRAAEDHLVMETERDFELETVKLYKDVKHSRNPKRPATDVEVDLEAGEETDEAGEETNEAREEIDEADESSSTSSREPPYKKVAFLDADFCQDGESVYAPSSARSSLNSIDFRFIDHLVGPGTTSSRLRTDTHLIIDQTDISMILMEARRSVIKKQSEISNVSDLLTINFIFDMVFIKKHLTMDISSNILYLSSPAPSKEDLTLLNDCSMFAAMHSFQDTKRHVRNKVAFMEQSLVGDILRNYTENASLWQQSSSYPGARSLPLKQNEDTYTQDVVRNIIVSLISDMEMLDHWGRDPLPTPNGFEEEYNPDFFAEYDGFPIFLVEIKKPGAGDSDLEGDRRKLPCMQKLMLDRMLTAGVVDPTVVGFLIKDSRCEISVMSLDNEALYILRPVGALELPRNNLQLSLLCPGLGPLQLTHDIVSKTLAAIKTRSGRYSTKARWRRPSYYVK